MGMNTLPHWTRSPETVEDYTDLVRRLARRFVPEAQSLRGTECWITWLERLRVQPWSEVTVRRYRAALLWFMESLDTFPQSPFWIAPDHREAILSAIRLPWAGESLTLPEQKKSRRGKGCGPSVGRDGNRSVSVLCRLRNGKPSCGWKRSCAQAFDR